MAVPEHAERRRDEASNWILTSIALSLLFHILLVHFLGGIRLLDVEVFTSSVSRWFNVVEIPELIPPEIATEVSQLPDQAVKPPEIELPKIPLIEPKRIEVPHALGKGAAPTARPHAPSITPAPEIDPNVVHRSGPPGLFETFRHLRHAPPVQPTGAKSAPPSGAGKRRVASGSPGLAAPPPVSLKLLGPRAQRRVALSHAAELSPPTIKPSPTPVRHGPAPPPGIVIPLEEAVAGQESKIPRIFLPPGAPAPAVAEPGPARIIPLGDEVRVQVTMYAEPGDPRHYFRLEIAVAKLEKLPVIPMDVMFICDVSLSIRRQELKITRKAISEYLGQLRRTDRFNVVVFSEQARKLFPDFVEPTPERIGAAARFVERIPGQIRTDVYRVLRSVVRDIAKQSIRNRPTSIFFISDGRSTSGIRDARRIINEIGAFSRPNFAIFPFDAGRGGNRYLLDLLAYRSRGAATFTDDVDEAGKLQAALFRAHDQPVLMSLRTSYTNLNVEETYPAFLPNLYAARPIVIYGRCTPGQNVTIQLQGKNPYARRALVYSHAPGAPDPSRRDIAREWARRKIHHIVSDMARFGETPELRAEIQRLGKQYNVRTPYNE